MTYLYNLPNATDGLDSILVETVREIPFLSTLLLLFIWFVVMLGGIGLQSRRLGTADYPMWSVVASLAVFLVALLMSVTSGLIRIDALVITFVITIFSFVWLFLNRKQSEI